MESTVVAVGHKIMAEAVEGSRIAVWLDGWLIGLHTHAKPPPELIDVYAVAWFYGWRARYILGGGEARTTPERMLRAVLLT